MNSMWMNGSSDKWVGEKISLWDWKEINKIKDELDINVQSKGHKISGVQYRRTVRRQVSDAKEEV